MFFIFFRGLPPHYLKGLSMSDQLGLEAFQKLDFWFGPSLGLGTLSLDQPEPLPFCFIVIGINLQGVSVLAKVLQVYHYNVPCVFPLVGDFLQDKTRAGIK